MTTHASRVWIVTGTSSGMGRSIARAALQAGARVLATAREPDQLRGLVAEFPDRTRSAQLDVTSPDQCAAAVALAVAEFGRIDVLVNNAGYGMVGAVEETSDRELRDVFETNFFGPINMIRAALPTLRAQHAGHIINMSAAAAISNYAGFSAYGGAKCALEGASESLAAELAPHGVRVTIVQPGPFRTDFIGRSLRRAKEHRAAYDSTCGKFWTFLNSINGKQTGDPDRAASAILKIVEAQRPPLRLALGSYAVGKTRKKLAAQNGEIDEWLSLATSTDFAS